MSAPSTAQRGAAPSLQARSPPRPPASRLAVLPAFSSRAPGDRRVSVLPEGSPGPADTSEARDTMPAIDPMTRADAPRFKTRAKPQTLVIVAIARRPATIANAIGTTGDPWLPHLSAST